MKSMKIAGLCLVAMFVVSMIASATASAATAEIAQCRNVGLGNGHWKDSQCTKPEAGGEWATRKGAEVGAETFSSVSGKGELETAEGVKVECEADRDTGVITSATEVGKVFVTFTGCTSEVLKVKVKCTGTKEGEKEGEIKTNELKGRVGFINSEATKAGLLFEPATTELYAEFNCAKELVKVKVKGKVIGEFTSPAVGELSKESKLVYGKGAGKGKQKITKFAGESAENSLEDSINGKAFEKSAIATEDTITYQFDTGIIG